MLRWRATAILSSPAFYHLDLMTKSKLHRDLWTEPSRYGLKVSALQTDLPSYMKV